MKPSRQLLASFLALAVVHSASAQTPEPTAGANATAYTPVLQINVGKVARQVSPLLYD